jgi:hydroxymethylpyrimidine/phosphomethylpyrimidine kinase
VRPPVALTIAGSDPSGGAGIQADLKTFHQFRVYGEAVITLITVQNTTTLSRVYCVPPDLVSEQIRAVLSDIPPGAVKLGALGDVEIITAVAAALSETTAPIIVDPVMIGKHGAALMQPDAMDAFKRLLLPRAFLVTPNAPEAAALCGRPVENCEDARTAAQSLVDMGARAALIKGGHLEGDMAVDVLLTDRFSTFSERRIPSRHTHGSGCTYAAAITAGIARGSALEKAVASAKRFVTDAIAGAPGLGHGNGPLDHFA